MISAVKIHFFDDKSSEKPHFFDDKNGGKPHFFEDKMPMTVANQAVMRPSKWGGKV